MISNTSYPKYEKIHADALQSALQEAIQTANAAYGESRYTKEDFMEKYFYGASVKEIQELIKKHLPELVI